MNDSETTWTAGTLRVVLTRYPKTMPVAIAVDGNPNHFELEIEDGQLVAHPAIRTPNAGEPACIPPMDGKEVGASCEPTVGKSLHPDNP